MTTVVCDLVNIGGASAAFAGAVLEFNTVEPEGRGDKVVLPEPKRVVMSDTGTTDPVTLLPGDAVVTFRWGSDRVARARVRVPESGQVRLSDLLKAEAAVHSAVVDEITALLSSANESLSKVEAAKTAAESVVTSTKWVGDQLSVNGVLSPHLRGATGAKGDKGDPGTAASIPAYDTQPAANTLVMRDKLGDVRVRDIPTTAGAVNRGYVDKQAALKANLTHTHTAADITDLSDSVVSPTVLEQKLAELMTPKRLWHYGNLSLYGWGSVRCLRTSYIWKPYLRVGDTLITTITGVPFSSSGHVVAGTAIRYHMDANNPVYETVGIRLTLGSGSSLYLTEPVERTDWYYIISLTWIEGV